jgi:hypothetical protein
MTQRFLVLCAAVAIASAPAALFAKDRAWQTGELLDKTLNPYFRTVASDPGGVSSSNSASFGSGDNGALAVKAHQAEGDVTYDNYVVAGADTVYLVEFAHFKNFPVANVSMAKPVTFAIEKNKLILLDLDHREFEATILKQTNKHGTAVASAAAPAKPVAEPAKKLEAKKEEPKESVKSDKPKPPSSKPDNVFATAALSSQDSAPQRPKPAPQPPTQPQSAQQQPQPQAQAQNVQQPAPPPAQQPAKPVVVASVSKPPATKPDPAPATKPAPKAEAAVTKPAPRPEGPVAHATTKDRAWQSGHLLSVASNNFFFNVTYSSDTDGSAWPFSQGSDGRYTVTGQIATESGSAYTYDNYVLESEFVAYLVQRMRPKTSPAVRLPGTKPLKFAVEKNKLWVLDDQGIEYETKIVKLIQKDSIVDPSARAAAR